VLGAILDQLRHVDRGRRPLGQRVCWCLPVGLGTVSHDCDFVAVAPTSSYAVWQPPRVVRGARADHHHARAELSRPLAGLTAYQGAFQFGGLVAGQTVLVLGASGERTGCRPMVATGNPRRPS
jgi:NADPH:quinone reductase-like Zn-dependent oxidoreductase